MSSIHIEPENLPDLAHHNHGKTVSAWVLNAAIVLGGLFAAIGIGIPNHVFTVIGAVIMVAGVIAGAILKALGYGQPANVPLSDIKIVKN